MNKIWQLAKENLRLTTKDILSDILFNFLGTLLLYLTFFIALRVLLPHIAFIELADYLYAGILALISAVTAYSFSSFDINRIVNNTHHVDQFQVAGLSPSQIYFGKTIYYVVRVMGHVTLSGLFIILFSRFSIDFVSFLLIWIYLLIGTIFLIQIGLVVGVYIQSQTLHLYSVLFILVPLMLMSGFLTPLSMTQGFFWAAFSYFPTSILVEGARTVSVHHSVNILFIIYLLVLDGITVWLGRYFFIKRLER